MKTTLFLVIVISWLVLGFVGMIWMHIVNVKGMNVRGYYFDGEQIFFSILAIIDGPCTLWLVALSLIEDSLEKKKKRS